MKASSIAAVFMVAVALAGCSDGPAAPPPEVPSKPMVTMSLEGPSAVTGGWVEAEFGFRFQCSYTVRATATGDPGAFATWTKLRVRMTTFQGSEYVDSVFATGVRDLFKADEIRPGQVQQAQIGSGIPFLDLSRRNAVSAAHGALWTLEYQTAGETRTVSYAVGCNPPPPPAAVTLPLGKFVLVTLDGQPLPASASSWKVYADTLEFFPDTTSMHSSRVQGSGPDTYYYKSRREKYEVVGQDSFALPLIQGVSAASPVIRSGTSLLYRERGHGGRPRILWRFEPLGSPASSSGAPVARRGSTVPSGAPGRGAADGEALRAASVPVGRKVSAKSGSTEFEDRP